MFLGYGGGGDERERDIRLGFSKRLGEMRSGFPGEEQRKVEVGGLGKQDDSKNVAVSRKTDGNISCTGDVTLPLQ